MSNWSNEEGSDSKLKGLNTFLTTASDMSPIRYPLKKPIADLQENTLRMYKRKALEAIDCVLESVAPGQSAEFFELLKQPDEINCANDSDLIDTVIQLYNETEDNKIKVQLLALISSKVSKSDLQKKVPGLTKYQIDQSRLMSAMNNKGIIVSSAPKFKRNRMNEEKLEHCISFFFDPLFTQIVSHSVREIELDSGDVLQIPDVVRTVFHSTLIDMYVAYCKETSFEPLGNSTLYRVLNNCPASKRKSLNCIDNIASDGIASYECLLTIAEKLRPKYPDKMTDIIKKIKESKLYLKTDYKLHIKDSDPCADHCRNFALSDPKEEVFATLCQHEHLIQCDRCGLLGEIHDTLKQYINRESSQEEKNILLHELSNSKGKIEIWKSHIIRTVNQDCCRTEMITALKPNQMIIIMDWAMKFLPLLYRQKQSDWFGQKGLNWHVCVCIFRQDSDVKVRLKHVSFSFNQAGSLVASTGLTFSVANCTVRTSQYSSHLKFLTITMKHHLTIINKDMQYKGNG